MLLETEFFRRLPLDRSRAEEASQLPPVDQGRVLAFALIADERTLLQPRKTVARLTENSEVASFTVIRSGTPTASVHLWADLGQ